MARKVTFAGLGVEADCEALCRRSQLVSGLLNAQESPRREAILTVPDWLTKSLLQQYLATLTTSSLPKAESGQATELLKTACYFRDARLQEMLVTCPCLNAFAPDSILVLFTLAAEHRSDSAAWCDYFKKTLSYAKGHISFLLERCSAALAQTPPSALELLLLESLKSDFGRPVTDHAPIIRTLKSVWNSPSIPAMLELTEKRAKETPPAAISLAWDFLLSDSTQFYESPEFEVEGLAWVFQLWYYAKEDRLDCFIGNGVGERQHIPGALVALALNFTLFADDCLTETKVITLLLGSKGHKLVRSVYGLRNRVEKGRLTLVARSRLEYRPGVASRFISSHRRQR